MAGFGERLCQPLGHFQVAASITEEKFRHGNSALSDDGFASNGAAVNPQVARWPRSKSDVPLSLRWKSLF
jgi:hypothetical protein